MKKKRNKRFHSLIAVSILLVFLTSCASDNSVRTNNGRPVTRAFDMDTTVVMKAVKRILRKKQYTLNSERTNGQHLETRWAQTGSYRNMVKADVKSLAKNKTELALQLILEKQTTWNKSWQPADEIKKDVYEDFMDEVQMECYRVLYER